MWCYCILLMSCAKELATPLNYTKSMIILGAGGGFTGAFSEYYLMENGQVFRSGNSDTTYTYVGRFSKTLTSQFFDSYDMLRFDEMKLDEPGNRYFYISRKKGDQANKILWGYQELSNKTPAIYHQNFMSKIKDLQSENTSQNKN